MSKKTKDLRNNSKFIDSSLMNDMTFLDYLNRFTQLALSMFEWTNLPDSMDSRFLEMCLFEDGQACLLYDNNYGFINLRCADSGELNIYKLPTKLNCYSFNFQQIRKLYTGLQNQNLNDDDSAILVMNRWDRTPTLNSMTLFALRLYEADRTADVNIKAQKTPVLLLCDETQRIMIENLYNQYNGNQPFIFGDKSQLNESVIKSIRTDAPFVADKIMEYKKEIWNEALTFLGINNMVNDKKERMITDEANSNNELINLNLSSFLAPRQKACDQFNKKFNLEGENKISVKVRSDLHNVIKNLMSITTDLQNIEPVDSENEVLENE